MILAICLSALGLLVNMFLVEFHGGDPLWLYVTLVFFVLTAVMAVASWQRK